MSYNTPIGSIICFLLAGFIGAVGQYLYKTGADVSDGTLAGYLLNPRLLLGVVCYVGVMVLFVAGFRIGGRVSALYPLYATTFIWAALISRITQGTVITTVNGFGMLLLIVAIWMVVQGGTQ